MVQRPELAMPTSHDPSFEMVRIDQFDNVLISGWESVQIEQIKLWSDEAAAAPDKQAPGVGDHCPIKNCQNKNDDGITRKVKSAMKDLVANDMATVGGEELDDVLRRTLRNAHSGVWSAAYKLVQQGMLDLLRTETIGKTFDNYPAN